MSIPRIGLPAVICILLFSQIACTTMRAVDENVLIDPTGKNIIYRDAWVRRNPPEVHVSPTSAAPADLKVLFIPFRVTQPMDNPTILGYTTSRIVWQTWLQMRLFPNMEFSGDDTPYRRDRALALARGRGMDMVVGGFVTHVYSGGTVGESQLALQLEAYDVRSGQLVWSMAQGGKIPAPQTTDYFIVAAKTRMPSDPLHTLTQVLASDMGQRIQTWIVGPATETRWQQRDRQVHDAIFAPRDPVPAPRTGYEPAEEENNTRENTPESAF